MRAKATNEFKHSHWGQLNNYAKERLQFNFISTLIMEEATKHPNIEVRLHYRTRKRKTTDADILLLKDGKVRCQIELGHLWPTTFKNVDYALNPRREALLECRKLRTADSFKSYYIQNGGRNNAYLHNACKQNGWTLYCFPLIPHMTRSDIRNIKKAIHQIFTHADSEQYVYDKKHSKHCKEFGVGFSEGFVDDESLNGHCESERPDPLSDYFEYITHLLHGRHRSEIHKISHSLWENQIEAHEQRRDRQISAHGAGGYDLIRLEELLLLKVNRGVNVGKTRN